MTEVLWHGRGGQGAFTAARLLGEAYALKDLNSFALAFPSFGPERRGAPIRAFTKLDNKPIGNRSETKKADFSIFLDDTLFSEEAFNELKQGGVIILNSKKPIEDKRVFVIDADSIAEEILKRPITNTVLLGAFSAVYDGICIDDVIFAIKQGMPERLHKRNIEAALAAAKAAEEAFK